MCEQPKPKAVMNQAAAPPTDLKNQLLAEYGDALEGSNLSDAQASEMLHALWQIMTAFVEVGFSVKAGENLHENTDLGMDDVLRYLIPVETAPETVAPKNSQKNKESR